MRNAKVTITSALLAIAAFSSMADAKCAFTQPLAESSYAAGDTMPVQWIDDGSEPKCSDMTLGIDLRVGSQDVQKVAAPVTDSVPGSAGSASFVVPQKLAYTDSTYFLEMHKKDAPKEFQNFSGRFSLTGVEGDPSGDGNGTSSDDGPNNKGSSSDTTDSNSSSDSNSTDTSDDSNDSSSGNTKNKGSSSKDSGDKSTNDSTSSDSSSSSASDGKSSNATANDNPPQQANSASSWSASFTSLAIVAVGAVLSNVF